MSRLALTFACCRYDRMDAIREGDVVPAGLTLNCITLRSGPAIWARGHLMHQFDVDIATIRWVEGAVGKPGAGRPHAPALLRPVQIEQNIGAEPLGALLSAGRSTR